MKYLFTLFFAYLVLVAADLFFLRMFPHTAISASLIFLLASAVAAPQKTRYVYRALLPITIICGFVADILSSRGQGIVFTSYVLMALIIVLIIKNLPHGGNTQIFAALFFIITFVYRTVMSLWGGVHSMFFVSQIMFIISSSLFSSVGAIILLFFINSKYLEKISKLLFREEL